MTPTEIIALRHKLKMTQRQFATLLGIKNENRISYWENGKGKPSSSAIALMKVIKATGKF